MKNQDVWLVTLHFKYKGAQYLSCPRAHIWLSAHLLQSMKGRMLEKKNWRKSRIISLRENERLVVIIFYSSSCLGQKIAKKTFSLRVKLPPA